LTLNANLCGFDQSYWQKNLRASLSDWHVTSPNDVISDKLVFSRDNETDSETEIKKGIRGQTGTWSLKDKRDVFCGLFFIIAVQRA